MSLEQELKQIIKEEIESYLKEDDYNDEVQSIESMMMDLKDANAEGNQKKAEELFKLITPQIISMGFDRPHVLKIQQSMRQMVTDRDAYKLLSTYKLIAEADATEGPNDEVFKYKVIVSIPFSTSKNKDERVKQLKYDLVTSGVKILGIKELSVSKIASAGDEDVIQLDVMMVLKTWKQRTELENSLQPNYILVKIRDITDGDQQQANS